MPESSRFARDLSGDGRLVRLGFEFHALDRQGLLGFDGCLVLQGPSFGKLVLKFDLSLGGV